MGYPGAGAITTAAGHHRGERRREGLSTTGISRIVPARDPLKEPRPWSAAPLAGARPAAMGGQTGEVKRSAGKAPGAQCVLPGRVAHPHDRGGHHRAASVLVSSLAAALEWCTASPQVFHLASDGIQSFTGSSLCCWPAPPSSLVMGHHRPVGGSRLLGLRVEPNVQGWSTGSNPIATSKTPMPIGAPKLGKSRPATAPLHGTRSAGGQHSAAAGDSPEVGICPASGWTYRHTSWDRGPREDASLIRRCAAHHPTTTCTSHGAAGRLHSATSSKCPHRDLMLAGPSPC